MLPGLGTLTNSGSMPINAGGGAAAPSAARAENRIGGASNGNISFGQPMWKLAAVIGVAGVLMWWGCKK